MGEVFSQKEIELVLLKKIRQVIPDAVQKRYDELSEKLREERISQDERRELLELVDVTELANAERAVYLIELASLRGRALREVMEQLGIQPPNIFSGEPLLKLTGTFVTEMIDVGTRHDEFIGEALMDDHVECC